MGVKRQEQESTSSAEVGYTWVYTATPRRLQVVVQIQLCIMTVQILKYWGHTHTARWPQNSTCYSVFVLLAKFNMVGSLAAACVWLFVWPSTRRRWAGVGGCQSRCVRVLGPTSILAAWQSQVDPLITVSTGRGGGGVVTSGDRHARHLRSAVSGSFNAIRSLWQDDLYGCGRKRSLLNLVTLSRQKEWDKPRNIGQDTVGGTRFERWSFQIRSRSTSHCIEPFCFLLRILSILWFWHVTYYQHQTNLLPPFTG